MMRRILCTLVAVSALTLGLAPLGRAQSSSIEFLNPSGYTSATERTLSAKTDGDNTYHLVAWVRNMPASPLVEFELRPIPTGNANTVVATRMGNTFEHRLELGGLADGAYELSATLYSNLNPVADDTETVTINNSDIPPPSAASTVEILNPENGERAGYFTPEGKSAGFLVSTLASEGTESVRVLYSMSDPGNEPEWQQCGTGSPDASQISQVRCALASGHAPGEVTAIAAVANKAPPPDPPAAADDTGDAHAVVPYLQQAGNVEVSPTPVTEDISDCIKFTLAVEDQFNQPIAGMNVDVHATGPGDQVQFATLDTTPVTNDTDPFQAPDRGSTAHRHTIENAIRCSNDSNLGQQGETNLPGADDIKHIESTSPMNSLGGTDNFGRWDFALHSRTQGPTQIAAWADSNGDDVMGTSEASGGAQLGWGQPPPPPVDEVFLSQGANSATTGSCVPFELLARRGGNAYAGANVDLHLTGPDAGVTFCDVAGGTARRPPDGGGHVGDAHEDGTRHAEGETDTAGKFVFGVTSATQGSTTVYVWLDSSGDDLPTTGEPSRTATVSWQPPGDRTISISSNKSSVRKGRRVRLSGSIEGDPACSSAQAVEIQSKPLRGGSFGTVKTVTTDEEGLYSTRVKIRSSRRFRAVAPEAGACVDARSNTITVRARN
jgi:hypothetical protein